MAEPLCPYFRRCGGCLYQHVEYPEQLRKKEETVRQATGCDSIEVFASEPYFYRSRMDFIFHSEGLGLRERRRWWRIVNVESCVIATQALNNLVAEVLGFFRPVDAFDVRLKKGTFRFAVFRTPPSDSSISIVVNKAAGNLETTLEKIREFAARTTANNVLATLVPPNRDVSVSDEFYVLKGSPFLEEELLGKKFRYPVQGFFQNNHAMTEKLHRYVRAILEERSGRRSYLLDLYAGVGTFGLLNADLFREVYLLENYPPAIEAAHLNVSHLGVKNATTIQEDAKNIHKLGNISSLVAVADPPRSGLHPRVLKYFKATKPRLILYISCNIKQLQRDLKSLNQFRVERVALFDFFPHTPHLEAVVELRPGSR